MPAISSRFLGAVLFAVLISACSSANAPLSPGAPTIGQSGNSPFEATRTLKLKTFTAGVTPGFEKHANAWDITAGPNDTLWFSDICLNKIGRLNPTTGKVKEFSTGLRANSTPLSIISASDGNLWFSDAGNGDVGRVTPTGSIVEYANPRFATAYAMSIVESNDAIWSVEKDIGKTPSSYLARVSLQGEMTVVMIPSDLSATGPIAADGSGNVWFMAINAKKQLFLVQLRPDGRFQKFPTGLISGAEPCCPNTSPRNLLIGKNGDAWFTTLYYASPETGPTNELARRSLSEMHYYPLKLTTPDKSEFYLSSIATDGNNMWVSGDNIGEVEGALYQVQADGKYKAYSVPYVPVSITVANGTVWFTSSWLRFPGQISEVLSE